MSDSNSNGGSILVNIGIGLFGLWFLWMPSEPPLKVENIIDGQFESKIISVDLSEGEYDDSFSVVSESGRIFIDEGFYEDLKPYVDNTCIFIFKDEGKERIVEFGEQDVNWVLIDVVDCHIKPVEKTVT